MILHLLKQADDELRNVPTKFASSKQLETELIAKNELKAQLKNAMDVNYKKLKEMSNHVVTITSPDQAKIIIKEVSPVINYPAFYRLVFSPY